MNFRVDNNLKLAPLSLTGRDAEAARWLFSFLAGIEQAAVLYAEKGFGVEGQLEDELSHKATFEAIAAHYGKVEPLGSPVRRLLEFLESQEGDIAKFLFGVVCETWVEGIFHRLAEWCPMFEKLEEEEARHAKASIRMFDPTEAEPVLREVEGLIRDVANSPYFLVPMAQLLGIAETARLGLDNAKRHQEMCRIVGLEAGGDIRALEEKCQTAIRAEARGLPRELELNAWQRSKMKVMKKTPYMYDSVVVPVGTESPAELEALTVLRLGRILSRHPEMNRTIRGNRLYEPANITIGVRRGYDKLGDLIVTVYIQDPHLKTVPEIRQEISEKLKKLRDRRYQEVPDFEGLEDLLPAPRCSVVLTQTGHLGVRNGFAAPIDHEGAAISVCLGKVEKKPFPSEGTHFMYAKLGMSICYTVDHRACDGREIGALSSELTREFRG